MDDEEHVAIHEAGHFVAHQRLLGDSGFYQDHVSIISDGESAGRFVAEPIEFPVVVDEDTVELARQDELFRRDAIIFLAGYAALKALGASEDAAILGCESDFEGAKALSSGDEQVFTLLKDETINLMSDSKNLAAVKLVAAELVKHKKISCSTLEILLEVIDGESDMDDYNLVREREG